MYNWDPPASWYEPDYEPEYECSDCDEKNETIEQAAEFLSAIVETLYSDQPLDLVDLESHLDELCHLLNVKMIPGDLKIQRRKENKILPVFPAKEDLIALNNSYLKLLTK